MGSVRKEGGFRARRGLSRLLAALAVLPLGAPSFGAAETVAYRVAEPVHKSVGIKGEESYLCRDLVDRYLSDAGREWIAAVLCESVPYRPYVRAKLKQKGMPMFHQYLPIVESDYKPWAVSPSGATGMWQFMENSMHPFLKKSDTYDERLDPWKETEAAILKLRDNYRMFDDWALALAAYNMGAGAMSRILRNHPGKDFWWLAEHGLLPKQTQEYVPKLIAIADVIENADYYGAIEVGVADRLIYGHKPPRFRYVKVTGRISLESLAERLGFDADELRKLNPALFSGHTPSGESWRVRLPRKE